MRKKYLNISIFEFMVYKLTEYSKKKSKLLFIESSFFPILPQPSIFVTVTRVHTCYMDSVLRLPMGTRVFVRQDG